MDHSLSAKEVVMNKCRIPKEDRLIKRYAFMTNFWRIFFYIAYIALWAIGYDFYLMYPINKPFVWWVLLIFAVLVAVSGWFIFDMTAFAKEKNIYGVTESMKISRNYGRGVTREGRFRIDYHTYRILTVRDSRGKRHRIRFQLFDDGYDLYYREGGRTAYFRGTKYPICLEGEKEGEHICVFCGVRTHAEIRNGEYGERPCRCAACGKPLMHTELLETELYGISKEEIK